jgi:hypothetical protein
VGTGRPGDTGGTPYAVSAGLTSSRLAGTQGLQVPGSLFRVALNTSSPVTLGASSFDYWFQLGEGILTPSTTGATPGRYPARAPDFWFSGFAEGQKALRGSAALVEERMGDGHVVLFSGEPNFRAFTEGSAFLLANALAYPDRPGSSGVDVGSAAAVDAVRVAMASASARPGFGPGRPIRLEVAVSDLAAAVDVAHRFTSDVRIERSDHGAILVIPNPAGLDAEWHPFAGRLVPALAAAGVAVRSAIL